MRTITGTKPDGCAVKSSVAQRDDADIEAILSLHNIELRRGENFRLSINELILAPGCLYILNGSNGSGKSSLLHLLALLLTPDSGDVLFAGKPVQTPADKKRFRRQITLVEQDPYLFDSTVYDNLAFGLRLRQIFGDLQRHRIDKALQAVGLSGFEGRPAKELSGGEIRRVALARALVLQPAVLLLDEPTSGLDRETQPLLESVLADLVQRGVTVVLSCHNSLQLGGLVAETLHLSAGKIQTETKNRSHNRS